MSVWRGEQPLAALGATGAGAQIVIPYPEVVAAPWFTMSPAGLGTFSRAGRVHVAASMSCVTGNASPEHASLVIFSGGRALSSRDGVQAGGWNTGGLGSAILDVVAGQTLQVTYRIEGNTGGDVLGVSNHGAGGRDLVITWLPTGPGQSAGLLAANGAAGQDNVTGDGTFHILKWSGTSVHPGLSLDGATGRVNCVTAGTYFFSVSAAHLGGSNAHEGVFLELRRNGARWFRSNLFSLDQPAGGHHIACGIPLEVGDYVEAAYMVAASTRVCDIISADTRFTYLRAAKVA